MKIIEIIKKSYSMLRNHPIKYIYAQESLCLVHSFQKLSLIAAKLR